MPQEEQAGQKATSPSKLIQRGIDNNWGQQQKATTDPNQALKDKHTNDPVKP